MQKYIPIDKYIKSVYDISTDILLWKSILDGVINDYNNEEYERDLLSSIFTIYNIDKSTGNGELKTFLSSDVRVTTKNIKEQKSSFFRWIINSSFLKIYNSLEILLQSVVLEEFLNQESINFGKKHIKIVNDEINKSFRENNLGKINTRNNRHLIGYLKFKSNSVNEFIKMPIRIGLKSSWEELFELISIMRNVIAHNGMFIENDTLNNINNLARDVYELYFDNNTKIEDLIVLNPKQEQVLNFINLINDFAINMVKFLKNESDLEFCGFKVVKV